MIAEGTKDNLIKPVPGATTFICEPSTHDTILDNITMKRILFFIKHNIYINIDREKNLIFMFEKTDGVFDKQT